MNLVCESSHLCHSFFPRDPNYHSSFQWNTYTNPYINTHTYIYIQTHDIYIYTHTHIYIYTNAFYLHLPYIYDPILSVLLMVSSILCHTVRYSHHFPFGSICTNILHFFPSYIPIYIPIMSPFTTISLLYLHYLQVFCNDTAILWYIFVRLYLS